MKRTMGLLGALVFFGAGSLVAQDEATADVRPGELWQFDWSWQEKEVPRTARIRPFVTAYDESGKTVWSDLVGVSFQRVFDPLDLTVQKWRVYGVVEGEGDAQKVRRLGRLFTVRLPAATRKVKLSHRRMGDEAKIGDIRFGLTRVCDPADRSSFGFPEMSEDGFDILTDDELDARLAVREKSVPKLVSRGSRTELQINGKPFWPRIYKVTTWANGNRIAAASTFARRGFNVFTISLSYVPSKNPNAAHATGICLPDGSCDVAKVRRQIREFLKRAPDALFMLDLLVLPPAGWAEKYPEEIFRNEKGQFGIFNRLRLAAYRDKLEYDMQSGEWPAFSYASETFAETAAAFLEQLFAGLEDTPEGKAVIGVYCCGSTDSQWLDMFNNSVREHQAADYSDVARRRFADFRRARCGRSDIDVEIPPTEAFWDAKKSHFSEHAPTALSDYREFYARVTTEFRLKLARGIKKGSRGRMLVGSYSPQGGLEGYPLISTTYSQGLFESPDYDFFAVVPTYDREHVDPVMAAIYDGTCARHGKLYISELDLRSSDVRHWSYWGTEFWRRHHTPATFRRKVLFFVADSLVRGGTYHAQDMDGGWFATEASQDTWQAANEMAAQAKVMPFAPERIAMVAGERYWDHQSFGRGRLVSYALREMPRDALARCGAPWNVYQTADLLGDDPVELPKVVVFTDLTDISHESYLKLMDRYAKDGRVLVWLYRPGLFAADGAKIDKALGLTAAPEAAGLLGFADGTVDDPLMKDVRGTVIACYRSLDRTDLLKPEVSAGWKPLAFFKGTTSPALAVRRRADCTEVYSSVPGGITPQLCRNFLRETGLAPLVESDELTGYGSGLFYLVAQSDGVKRFRLPKGVRPAKVLAGPSWTRSGEGYAVELRRGDIFVLSVK